MKGYIQVYTGNGKGKTTAALGLAVRAAGAGLNVFIGQFLKSGDFSEIKALKRFEDRIVVKQFGKGRFVKNKVSDDDIQAARKGLQEIKSAMLSNKFDMIIIEEGNVAVMLNVISVSDLLDLIDHKPPQTELVITGRNADPLIVQKADLVTEMKDIKHYYQEGVQARVGIEK